MDPDAQIAVAMNRVLDAERAAQTSIAECAAQGEELVKRARQRARSILERAHARIIALHAKAARAPEEPAAARDQAAGPVQRIGAAARPESPVRFEMAIAKLTDALLATGLEEM